MKLSILMPYHNESFEKIKSTFDSLNEQIDVDFNSIEIVISNNCEKPNEPIEIYKAYPKLKDHIKYVLCKYIDNIGMSRQNAIDNASGDYFICLDSDDVFPSNDVLKKYFSIMNQYSFDIIYCRDSEQVPINGKIKAITLAQSSKNVFVSGKLYRRDFIVKNNITFVPNILYSEDTLFNLNCLIHNPCTGDADFLAYTHVFNPDSITRKSSNAFLKTASEDFIKGILWLVEQNKDSPHKKYIFNLITTSFNDFVTRIEDKFNIPVRDLAIECYLKRLLNLE